MKVSIKTLTDAGAEKKSIKTYPDGFGIVFESFAEVALFFRNIGAQGSFNEHNRYSTTAHELDTDLAFDLASEASVEVVPGTFEVYWAGWVLSES
jgi:hypothetical protein